MICLVTRLVDVSRRQAPLVVGFILASVVGIGIAAVRHIGIDTDTGKLFSPTLPWRQAELQLDRAFPQNNDLLAIVIDAPTPDQAQDAATGLASRLAARPELFRDVRQPGGGMFFRKNGLLFLSQRRCRASPIRWSPRSRCSGTLASDPSARGVLNALALLAQGPLQAGTSIGAARPAVSGSGGSDRRGARRSVSTAVVAEPAERQRRHQVAPDRAGAAGAEFRRGAARSAGHRSHSRNRGQRRVCGRTRRAGTGDRTGGAGG